MIPCKTTALRWKSHLYDEHMLILRKMKLRCIKNTFHVARFQIDIGLSTKNLSKEAHVPKNRGALGQV